MALEDDLRQLELHRKRIVEEHGANLAIFFTDIVGSTAYFEKRGDLAGLALVKRHNALLFPQVETFQGRVVKTIGDSIMAVFDDPLAAARCGVEMMRTLKKETWSSDDPIHIRIGIHLGQVLRDQNDVFGDAVNTAARINSAAEPDEVLVSEELFRALPQGHGLSARAREVSAKGKAAPVPVVTVGWQQQAPLASQELFVLELSRGPTGLRVAAIDGAAQKGTVKAYSDVAVELSALDALADSIASLAQGGGAAAYEATLREKGAELFSRALPEAVRARLASTQVPALRLQLDDALTHIPWELAFDGTSFLGLRFGVGRLVAARADSLAAGGEKPSQGEQAVVVANPSGDLPAADEEGRVVARLLESVFPGRVTLRQGPLSTTDFLALLPQARVLHFAGHVRKEAAGRPGGFVLSNGLVTPERLALALAESAPELVFANACHASTGSRWGDAGSLAQGLLLSGVRHVLAPLYGVPDADALSFALRFYESLLSGQPHGEAARRARGALEGAAAAPLSWTGYVLYGDPRGRLGVAVQPVTDSGPTRAPRLNTGSNPALAATRPPGPGRGRPRWGAIGGAAAALLALAGGGWALTRRASPEGSAAPPPAQEAPAASGQPQAPAATRAARTGPIRLSVLAFKSAAKREDLAFMDEGISESLVTGLGADGFTLVERTQLEADLNELQFSQSQFVDPQTRAALGKVKGAEVVVVGGFQASGEKLRLTGRFVDVETGEVLASARVDGTTADAFGAQDQLTEAVKSKLPAITARLRP